MTTHILIVEDDEMLRSFIALHLENEGYGVSATGTGRESLSILAEEKIDLILLDLNLPDGDGLSIAQRIREVSTVPIIILTARKGKDDRLIALGLGADEYLTKPVDPKELFLRIRNLLDRMASIRPAHDPAAPSSTPAQTLKPQPQPVPQSLIEYDAPKEAKPRTRKGLLKAVPFLAGAAAVVIATIWPFTERAPTPSFVQAAFAANPAMDVTIVAPEAGAASHSAAVSAAAVEEDLARPISEVLGYGWVLNSQCAKVPEVKWWKYKSHESIAGYVTRKHGGDWAPYRKKWLRRLVKLHDIASRRSSAVTSTGIVLKGNELTAYIGKMRKRLSTIHCLAREAKEFSSSKQG